MSGSANLAGIGRDVSARAAGPTQQEASQLRAEEEALSAQPWVPNTNMYSNTLNPADTAGNQPPNFPSVAYPKQMARDTYQEVKANYLNGVNLTGQTINQVYDVRPEDIQYLVDKQNFIELAQFDSWASAQFNLKDPAQAELFYRLYPEYIERREALIMEIANVSAEYAKLKLRGVRSKKDMMLLWAIETDKIPYLNNPGFCIWNPQSWQTTTADQSFAGLFNPLQYVQENQPKLPTYYGSGMGSGTATAASGPAGILGRAGPLWNKADVSTAWQASASAMAGMWPQTPGN